MPNKKPELDQTELQEFLLVSTDGTAVTPTIEPSPTTTPQPLSPKGTPTLTGLFDDILDSSSSSSQPQNNLAAATAKKISCMPTDTDRLPNTSRPAPAATTTAAIEIQPSLSRTTSPQQTSATPALPRNTSPLQFKINQTKPANTNTLTAAIKPSAPITFPPAVVRSPINSVHNSSLSSSVFDETQMNRRFIHEPQRPTKKSFSEHVSETLDDLKDLFSGIGRSFINCFGSCFGCCTDNESSVNYRYGNAADMDLFMYSGRVNPINLDDPKTHAPSSPSISTNQTPYLRIPETTGVRKRLG